MEEATSTSSKVQLPKASKSATKSAKQRNTFYNCIPERFSSCFGTRSSVTDHETDCGIQNEGFSSGMSFHNIDDDIIEGNTSTCNPNKPDSPESVDMKPEFNNSHRKQTVTTSTDESNSPDLPDDDTKIAQDRKMRHVDNNMHRPSKDSGISGMGSRPQSMLENQENPLKLPTNELDHILQCISDAKARMKPSKRKLQEIQIQLDNFAGGFLEVQSGGVLTIPGRGISLDVPQGSLIPFTDEPQLVYIYIDQSNQDPLMTNDARDGKEAWITPVIICGPPGLRFTKPVFLSMPYKFNIDISQLRMSGYQSKTTTGGKWRRLQDGKEAVIIAQGDEIIMMLNHFCKYGCTLTGDTTKWMKAIVNVDHQTEDSCKIQLQILEITDTMDKANINRNNRYTEKISSSEIQVNNDGGPIIVTVHGIDIKWKLSDPSFTQIPCDDLWAYESPPTVTFNATVKETVDCEGPGTHSFCANVDIYQEDNHQPSTSLKIRDTKPKPIKTFDDIRRTVDQQFLETRFQHSVHFKEQERYHQVCVSLDTADDSCGWSQLGYQIGFAHKNTFEWIKHLIKTGDNPSPGSILLDFYFQGATEDDILNKMRCLSNYLMKINNHEAKKYVDDEIADRTRVDEPPILFSQDLHEQSNDRSNLRHSEANPSGKSESHETQHLKASSHDAKKYVDREIADGRREDKSEALSSQDLHEHESEERSNLRRFETKQSSKSELSETQRSPVKRKRMVRATSSLYHKTRDSWTLFSSKFMIRNSARKSHHDLQSINSHITEEDENESQLPALEVKGELTYKTAQPDVRDGQSQRNNCDVALRGKETNHSPTDSERAIGTISADDFQVNGNAIQNHEDILSETEVGESKRDSGVGGSIKSRPNSSVYQQDPSLIPIGTF